VNTTECSLVALIFTWAGGLVVGVRRLVASTAMCAAQPSERNVDKTSWTSCSLCLSRTAFIKTVGHSEIVLAFNSPRLQQFLRCVSGCWKENEDDDEHDSGGHIELDRLHEGWNEVPGRQSTTHSTLLVQNNRNPGNTTA